MPSDYTYPADNQLVTGEYMFVEFRRFYCSRQIILVLALFGFSCIGIINSFYTGSESESAIWLAVGSPAVLSLWTNLALH